MKPARICCDFHESLPDIERTLWFENAFGLLLRDEIGHYTLALRRHAREFIGLGQGHFSAARRFILVRH